MSVLDILRKTATVAGAGAQGYAEDQQNDVRATLAAAKAAQDAERNRVLNAISQRDLARVGPGDPGYGQYKATEIAATAPATTAAKVADINATAQPTADAKATEIRTTSAPAASAAAELDRARIAPAVEGQTALTPGVVSRAGQTAAATAANTPATNVFTTGLGENGKPAIVTGKSKGDPKLNVTAIGKPEAGGSGTSLRGLVGAIGAGSAIGSAKEMAASHPRLKQFESGFLTEVPTSDLDALDRFRLRLANGLHTDGIITAAKAAEAERELAAANPKLALYGRDLKQWIIGDLNVSKSPSDRKAIMDEAVSGLSIPMASLSLADRTSLIHAMWEGREGRLAGILTGTDAAQVILDKVSGKGKQPPDHSTLSDEEFAKQYRAGAFKRPP